MNSWSCPGDVRHIACQHGGSIHEGGVAWQSAGLGLGLSGCAAGTPCTDHPDPLGSDVQQTSWSSSDTD
jgi:hypothetical protein